MLLSFVNLYTCTLNLWKSVYRHETPWGFVLGYTKAFVFFVFIFNALFYSIPLKYPSFIHKLKITPPTFKKPSLNQDT